MEEQRRDAISHADFIRLENKVDNLLTAVNGNGEPGLMTRVRLLETYLWRAIGAAGAAALVLTLLEVLVHVGGRK